MLIQKTFHVAMALEAARAQLARFQEYRGALVDLQLEPPETEHGIRFAFRLPGGFKGEVELEEIPGSNRSQTLFKSRRGNLELVGIAEFFPVRAHRTEVVLTLEYTLCPWFYRVADALFHQVDQFLNRQLAGLETHFAFPLRVNGHAQPPSADRFFRE